MRDVGVAERFGWTPADAAAIFDPFGLTAAGWDEAKHPRGFHGEFGEGGYGLPSSGGHHPASDEERHALRVPPAWTDVTVADDQENAEVLARGRDGKGRIQAVYSAKHTMAAAAAKFERVNAFAAKAPRLDVALKTDVAHSDTAAAVLVMRRLGIRVGSDNDTHAKQQAYGTTTLQARHVEVIGDRTTFDFIGKKGVHIHLETDDPDIADAIRPRLTGKGPDDRLFATNEQQTIAYLRSHTGPKFKNHDLRTLLANEIAQREVNRDLSPAKTKAELARRRNAVGDAVAAQLGNNRSEALKSYVNPAVFRQWDPTGEFTGLTASGWDPNKHPRGEHGHWAETMSQSLHKFEKDGGQVSEVNPQEARWAKEDLIDTAEMAGTSDDVGVKFSAFALDAIHDFGEDHAKVLVANAEGVGIAGAISLVDYPEFVKVDYLGSTGVAHGAGTALAVEAAKYAKSLGLPLAGEPTGDALPFWKKLGWKLDPTEEGWSYWGWSKDDTAKAAAV